MVLRTNRAPGSMLNECSSKEWLRGAMPGGALQQGKIRRGSSEEEPLWKTPWSETRHDPSGERSLWETPVSGTRHGSSEEEPLWEALKRASSEVKAWPEWTPWWTLRRATAVENTPGDLSLVAAPKSRRRESCPRCQLQGGPSEEGSPGRRPLRAWRKAGKTRLQGVKPDQESVHPARGG